MDRESLQYVCPNCFCQRTVNDVLFLRRVVRQEIDHVKTRFWQGMKRTGEPYPVTNRLADWRLYPESRRVIREGIVQSLIDYTGDQIETRICPECHFPLRPLSQSTVLPLFWGQNGVDFALGERALAALARWKQEELPAQWDVSLHPYQRAFRGEGLCIELPMGLLQKGSPVDTGLLDRYLSGTNAVVLSLNGTEESTAVDLEIILSLTEELSGRGEQQTLPIAILMKERALFNSDEELADQIHQIHNHLMNAIASLFLNSRIFPAGERGMESALEWLAGCFPLERQD